MFFDFSNVRGKLPIDVPLLTGKRETVKQYSDVSGKKIVDEDFKMMRISSRSIPPEPGLIPQHSSSHRGFD